MGKAHRLLGVLVGQLGGSWARYSQQGGLLDAIHSVIKNQVPGIPGWCSGLAPAFGPGRDPGDPGSGPASGSRCMEPASPSACVSASLSLSLCVIIINE